MSQSLLFSILPKLLQPQQGQGMGSYCPFPVIRPFQKTNLNNTGYSDFEYF
jgi:hypothetical protein